MDIEADLGPLHLAIGTLSDEIKDLKHRLLSMQDDLVKSGAGICPTPTATFAIDLNGPTAGYRWEVRNIMVGGSDITTAPAGVAWVAIMADVPSANVPIFAVRDFTHGALPQSAFYGARELVIPDTERLWIIITGGTAGVQYSATACIENYKQFVKKV